MLTPAVMLARGLNARIEARLPSPAVDLPSSTRIRDSIKGWRIPETVAGLSAERRASSAWELGPSDWSSASRSNVLRRLNSCFPAFAGGAPNSRPIRRRIISFTLQSKCIIGSKLFQVSWRPPPQPEHKPAAFRVPAPFRYGCFSGTGYATDTRGHTDRTNGPDVL